MKQSESYLRRTRCSVGYRWGGIRWRNPVIRVQSKTWGLLESWTNLYHFSTELCNIVRKWHVCYRHEPFLTKCRNFLVIYWLSVFSISFSNTLMYSFISILKSLMIYQHKIHTIKPNPTALNCITKPRIIILNYWNIFTLAFTTRKDVVIQYFTFETGENQMSCSIRLKMNNPSR